MKYRLPKIVQENIGSSQLLDDEIWCSVFLSSDEAGLVDGDTIEKYFNHITSSDFIKYDSVPKKWGGEAGKRWASRILRKETSFDNSNDRGHNGAIMDATVLKIDEDLGLVMGFAIICNQNGEPYFDRQDDHIPEAAMLKAATDFMQNSRVMGEMHRKSAEERGSVVFAWPLTEDIAKALEIKTATTGLLVGMIPHNEEILAKYRSGEYTGFSIGGRRILDEEVTV